MTRKHGQGKTDLQKRLERALKISRLSIRGLSRELQKLRPKPTGAALPSVQGYVTKGKVPRLEWLKASAKTMKVSESWLIHGTGRPGLTADKAIKTVPLEFGMLGSTPPETGRMTNVPGVVFGDFEKILAAEGKVPDGALSWIVYEAVPDLLSLPPSVRQMFVQTWLRLLEGTTSTRSTDAQRAAVAVDLWKQINLPLEKWWGFRRDMEDRDLVDFYVGILHALTLAIPDQKQGDPLKVG